MTKLTIYIQCHNRPAYARCAIESVLRQTNQNFRLVISDNSSNDELQLLIQAEFPTLEYRRRIPMLSALDHFNISIAEADTDFLCLFHDDDLMEPGYVDSMLKAIALHPNAAAYSCNAEIFEDSVVKSHAFESADPFVVIANPRALAGRYFSRFPEGFAPFPAYIYKTHIIKNIPIHPHLGGKYSDVAWLLEISKHGSVVWNSEKLIRYRIHANNDGGFESTRDRLKLLGYLKANRQFVGQSLINDYRFFLYKKLLKGRGNDRKFRGRYVNTFRRFMSLYRLMRFFRSETYAYFSYKLGKFFSQAKR